MDDLGAERPFVADLLFQIDDSTRPKVAVANSFSVCTAGSRCLVVAANSETEKAKWMEDIQTAIVNARRSQELVSYRSLTSNCMYICSAQMNHTVNAD